MLSLYLLTLLPLLIGAILWLFHKEVVWWEWLASALLGVVVVSIISLSIDASLKDDIQIISGQITKATFYPEWVEEYQYQTCTTTTDAQGVSTTSCTWHTDYRTHYEYWEVKTNLSTYYGISQKFYKEILTNFGGQITVEKPYKSGFYKGDPNVYVAYNKTGFIYPVSETKHWQNPIKAARTVFSFPEVPENVSVYPYPKTKDWWRSKRLLGTSKNVMSVRDLDVLNAKLGPSKKVNVIIVGFKNKDSAMGKWQEAAWLGGKKNDLVLCYGGDPKKPSWVYVFGWTEKNEVKRNLERLLLENGINKAALFKIEQEILQNYEIKDWSKFNYIKPEPPGWAYTLTLAVMAIAQGLFWTIAIQNDVRK